MNDCLHSIKFMKVYCEVYCLFSRKKIPYIRRNMLNNKCTFLTIRHIFGELLRITFYISFRLFNTFIFGFTRMAQTSIGSVVKKSCGFSKLIKFCFVSFQKLMLGRSRVCRVGAFYFKDFLIHFWPTFAILSI